MTNLPILTDVKRSEVYKPATSKGFDIITSTVQPIITSMADIPAPRSTKRTDCLPISEKDLLKYLPQVRPYVDVFYTYPASVKDLKELFLPSKLWRMNTLYKIVTKMDVDGKGLIVDFRMKWQQLALFLQLMMHPRASVLKSRQIGISTVTVLMYGDDLWTRPMLVVGVVAQKQDAADGLKDKISFAWDNMDADIRGVFGVTKIEDNASSFGLSNGSSITAGLSFRGGTLHRFAWTEVGTIAMNDPARIEETLSGSNQALAAVPTNWMVSESTARGVNYFHKQFWGAVSLIGKNITMKDYVPLFFSWLDDDWCTSAIEVDIDDVTQDVIDKIEKEFKAYISTDLYRNSVLRKRERDDWHMSPNQKWWVVGALREMGYDLEFFFREYPHTPESAFYASSEGYWYKGVMDFIENANQLIGINDISTDAEDMRTSDMRVKDASPLYDASYEVIAVCDIGYKDPFHITYVQVFEIDNTSDKSVPNTTDRYRQGGSVAHTINLDDLRSYRTVVLGDNWGTGLKTDVYGKLIKDQPYGITRIVIPHDGDRGTVLKDSISVVDDFRSMGFSVESLTVTPSVVGDVPYVRRRLVDTTFDCINANKTVSSVRSYAKMYDKVNQIYKSTPKHDWASHGADCFRYICVSECVSSLIKPMLSYTNYENQLGVESYELGSTPY